MIAIFVITILILLSCIGVLNWVFAYRLSEAPFIPEAQLPSVSVLIPARNESHRLPQLLDSLLKSDLQLKEILILDDQSSDSTAEVAKSILQRGVIPFRVIRGAEWTIRSGMLGKSHACQQLADQAQGEVLLFCDADVRVSPPAVRLTLQMMKSLKCAGVSALPQQLTQGLREGQLIPWVMQIPLILTLPLRWGWRSRWASLQVANGQWIAIWGDAYRAIGGHRALGLEVLEDMKLARLAASRGIGGIVPVLAGEDLQVLMYPSWDDLVQGFSKNLILIYGGSPLGFISLLALTDVVFSFPFWGWIASPGLTGLSLVLICLCRALTSSLLGVSGSTWINQMILHGYSLLLLNRLGLSALYRKFKAELVWKDRPIVS